MWQQQQPLILYAYLFLKNRGNKLFLFLYSVFKDSIHNYVRDDEIDAFISAANEHISNIKFRMLSNQQRGRNISNDTAVQSVFIMLQHMYPELHGFIKLLDDKQGLLFIYGRMIK